MTQACIAEARSRAELASTVDALERARRLEREAAADRALLAEIQGSAAWRTVARYRRAVNEKLPAGSMRGRLLRPVLALLRRALPR